MVDNMEDAVKGFDIATLAFHDPNMMENNHLINKDFDYTIVKDIQWKSKCCSDPRTINSSDVQYWSGTVPREFIQRHQ